VSVGSVSAVSSVIGRWLPPLCSIASSILPAFASSGVSQYPANSLLQFSATIAPVVNAAMTFKIRTPDGVITDYSSTVESNSLGNYVASFLPVQPGPHQYEWVATGAAQTSSIGQFYCTPGLF